MLTSSIKISLPLRRGRVRVGVIVIPENNHPPRSFAKASERRLDPLPSREEKMDEYKIKNYKINSARINNFDPQAVLFYNRE